MTESRRDPTGSTAPDASPDGSDNDPSERAGDTVACCGGDEWCAVAAAGAGAAAATAVALPDDGDTAAAGEVMRPLGERVSTAFHDLVGLIVTRGAGAGAGAASVSGSGTVGSCHHAHTHQATTM
mgnify:CR=1 FL=1